MGPYGTSDIIPAMILPETVFFPCSILPIYIYEEKHRLMLEEVISGDRMMTILNTDESSLEYALSDNADIGVTLGCVHACQNYEDGTSLLLLEGIERVGLLGIIEVEPFTKVQIEFSDQPPAFDPLLEILKAESLQLLESIRKAGGGISESLIGELRSIDLPQVFVDHAVAHLIRDFSTKQFTLNSRDPIRRFDALNLYLRKDLRSIHHLNRALNSRIPSDVRRN